MEEREIDLLDMMFEILLHWRMIIGCMLLFAVLTGGFSYVKSYRAAQVQNREIQNIEELQKEEGSREKLIADLKEELEASQLLNVQKIMDLEAHRTIRQKYYDESVLMQLDPLCVSRMDMVFGIVTEDKDVASSIAVMYSELLNGTELAVYLADKVSGRNTSDISELVSASDNVKTSGPAVGQAVRVVVIEENEEACRALAKEVLSYVKRIDLTEMFGSYKLVEMENSYSEISDFYLYDQQKKIRDELFATERDIAATKEALTEEEIQYYKLLASEEGDITQSEKETSLPAMARPAVSKKYVLLGLVLGAFVYAFFLAFLYIMSGKLRYHDDIANLYQIPELGQVPGKASKKKFLGFVDQWLISLRYRGKRQFSAEEAVRLAAVAVKMEAIKGGFNAVYCVGCEMQKGAEAVCKELDNMLQKDGISVTDINNILYDAESRERLQEVKAVVLVEKAGVAMYQEIADELELLRRQGIQVLGGIVVE